MPIHCVREVVIMPQGLAWKMIAANDVMTGMVMMALMTPHRKAA